MMPLAVVPAFALGGVMTGGVDAAAPASVAVGAAPHLAAAATGGPTTLIRDADGLFYVTARVDGRPIRFAVDTGASVVVLSQADAARAGVIGSDTAPGIATANGTTAMQAGEARSLRIGARSFGPVPVTIAPQGNVSLIGQNILARYREIRIRGDRMDLL